MKLLIIGVKTATYHNYDADSERTLERYVQEGTSLLHQNPALQRSCRPSSCSRRARASFAEQDNRESRHQHLQPPRCNGKGRGIHSVLRSGVEQRSFAHAELSLGALLSPLSDVGRKQRTSRRRTRYDHGAAMTLTAAHSRPCTAICPHVRIACLHLSNLFISQLACRKGASEDCRSVAGLCQHIREVRYDVTFATPKIIREASSPTPCGWQQKLTRMARYFGGRQHCMLSSRWCEETQEC